jgi:preprotein translocase subunit SecB
MLSPIQLEEHKILRIDFETQIIEGQSAPLVFRHALTASQQSDQERKWLVRLDVQFIPDSDSGTAPYTGEIAMAGLFTLSDDFPIEKASDMVHMNGGAILFGAMRELLSSISARGIHGPIMLPSVDARCFLPEPATEREDSSNRTVV